MKADQLTPPGPTHKTFYVHWKNIAPGGYVIAELAFFNWPLSMTAGKLLEEVVCRLSRRSEGKDCDLQKKLKEGKPLLMLGDVALNNFPNMSLACLGISGSPLVFGFEGSHY